MEQASFQEGAILSFPQSIVSLHPNSKNFSRSISVCTLSRCKRSEDQCQNLRKALKNRKDCSMAETVVGLALGVLPLLISAAEHYEDVVRPFKRYRQFSVELKHFQQEFLGHKTVFRNECLLLLSSITDRDTASAMMAEREHPLWLSPELTEKLSNQLGSSREACQATIGLIMEELVRIERDTESFRSADMEASSVSIFFIFHLTLANAKGVSEQQERRETPQSMAPTSHQKAQFLHL